MPTCTNDGSMMPPAAMGGMDAPMMEAMPPAAMGGMGPMHMEMMPPEQYGQVWTLQ